MVSEEWETLGLAGIKVLIALYESNGELTYTNAMRRAGVGGGSLERIIRDLGGKYITVGEGRIRLTERGRLIATMLKCVDAALEYTEIKL